MKNAGTEGPAFHTAQSKKFFLGFAHQICFYPEAATGTNKCIWRENYKYNSWIKQHQPSTIAYFENNNSIKWTRLWQ